MNLAEEMYTPVRSNVLSLLQPAFLQISAVCFLGIKFNQVTHFASPDNVTTLPGTLPSLLFSLARYGHLRGFLTDEIHGQTLTPAPFTNLYFGAIMPRNLARNFFKRKYERSWKSQCTSQGRLFYHLSCQVHRIKTYNGGRKSHSSPYMNKHTQTINIYTLTFKDSVARAAYWLTKQSPTLPTASYSNTARDQFCLIGWNHVTMILVFTQLVSCGVCMGYSIQIQKKRKEMGRTLHQNPPLGHTQCHSQGVGGNQWEMLYWLGMGGGIWHRRNAAVPLWIFFSTRCSDVPVL